MKNKGKVTLTGRCKIYLNDTKVRDVKNLIVTGGKEFIADRMQGTSVGVMSWIAIGTGNTRAVIGDTTLDSENAKIATDTSGGSVEGTVITYTTTVPAGTGTGAITESGIFNNAARNTGDLLARTVFSVVNKSALDTMTISWDVTIS